MDREAAHTDMNPRPSNAPQGVCASCHGEITDTFVTSIHYTIKGMANFFDRLVCPGVLEEEGNGFKTAFDKNCYKCHASCGSCHVSRPVAYGAGLQAEHLFAKTPPMDESCFGCHGARNAGEFMGVVGYTKDVHFDMGMHCNDCHPVNNFHGTGEVEQNMYEAGLPSCTDCHDQVLSADTSVGAHRQHGDDLNCQACHASANNNCFSCHATKEPNGTVVGVAGEMRLMFKIGLNPNPTEERPYKYISLRHIPTVIDTFSSLEGDLPNYHEVPNWKYSPTHNIQRVTMQNETCNSCHGNEYIFLREQDLRDDDSEANRDLVVTKIPPQLN